MKDPIYQSIRLFANIRHSGFNPCNIYENPCPIKLAKDLAGKYEKRLPDVDFSLVAELLLAEYTKKG